MRDNLQKELHNHLLELEQRLKEAQHSPEPQEVAQIQTWAQEAKIALSPYPTDSYTGVSAAEKIRSTIMSLLRHRGAQKSICPSEVARMIAPPDQWRAKMPQVRAIATDLAAKDILTITRRETVLDPADLGKGHIRLRQGRHFY